ncbi:tRNA threonylcarbamoyladenosine biosynthesis protein RimN [Zobellella denitrificans]|jgi:L-threonylcarbamoyladenylate synthase|uniref:Sua5/YciO/YrdC/YwlC family protein n=1 Tax=Zobellella denitrificans TaxID=347534 RepID=UPI000B8C0615|nr:Sua5/YciO/YrdC/YwlC family protein [Zobellella denitrificans]OXS16584.1 tRNA threonylcarbamoyladenosine biosynthesis protein RimN [Zobellella denitrificans]
MNPQDLLTAVEHLNKGAVIGYATEAVFGLGCDPDNGEAVRRLLEIKQRPEEKGLVLIAADFSQLRPYLDLAALPPGRLEVILDSWPGPYTWVIPARPEVPLWLRGRFDSLAVRVTSHRQAHDLCLAFGKPLVSTSANKAGDEPARTVEALSSRLGGELDFILPGVTDGLANPSLIRDGITGETLRPA